MYSSSGLSCLAAIEVFRSEMIRVGYSIGLAPDYRRHTGCISTLWCSFKKENNRPKYKTLAWCSVETLDRFGDGWVPVGTALNTS